MIDDVIGIRFHRKQSIISVLLLFVNNNHMSGLNLIYSCNDVINMCIVRERVCAALALQTRECVCVCVWVITSRAGCIHKQNGCTTGDAHDAMLSVVMFSPLHVSQNLITGVSAGR